MSYWKERELQKVLTAILAPQNPLGICSYSLLLEIVWQREAPKWGRYLMERVTEIFARFSRIQNCRK